MTRVDYARTDCRDYETLAFDPIGHCYGPFRWFREIPDLDKYRAVLHLRDPRDGLVSEYFSFGFSHVTKTKKQIEHRDWVRQQTIDEYVLQVAEKKLDIHQAYVEQLLPRPNVLYVTYEQMIEDFDGWLQRIAEHTDLAIPEALDRIKATHVSSVEKEDPTKHVRQMTPGDHLRKLKPETIERLNDQFRPVLDALGYPLDAAAAPAGQAAGEPRVG